MLHIKELLGRSRLQKVRRAVPVARSVPVHRPKQTETLAAADEPKQTETPDMTGEPEQTETLAAPDEPKQTEIPDTTSEPEQAEVLAAPDEPKQTGTPDMTSEPDQTETPDTTSEPEQTETPAAPDEPEQVETSETPTHEDAAAERQTDISLQDTIAEADELEHVSKKIGLDVTDMIDMEKEDFLIRQIDEFREKARQLQQLMQSREIKAQELQGVVEEKEAQASELDDLIDVRRGEAEKIMNNVTESIDKMSVGVREEMSGLSDTVSREVGGLSQNLTQELNQSTVKTCRAVETATQNMIDQNTRSLEGLKEQLDQLGRQEQIGELSTEMNSQITTLKTDIAEKIHAEDVKCYRNIQASLEEQGKVLTERDDKLRRFIREQVDTLNQQAKRQFILSIVSLAFSVLNFFGVVGILVYLMLF